MMMEGEVTPSALKCIELLATMHEKDHVIEHTLEELNHILFAHTSIQEYEASMMDDNFIDRGY
jgi:hypothetical protein